MHIEPRRAARSCNLLQRRFRERDALDARQPLNRREILFKQDAHGRLMRKHLDRHFDLGLDFQFRPQVAHTDD